MDLEQNKYNVALFFNNGKFSYLQANFSWILNAGKQPNQVKFLIPQIELVSGLLLWLI